MRLTKVRLGALVSACLLLAVPLTALGLAADDDVPGVPLPRSGFEGRLDAVTAVAEKRDVGDAYELELAEGQWFYASMTGSSGTDFDLYLYGPEASTTRGSQRAVAYSEKEGTSSERILYRAVTAGKYYLQAHAFEGVGTYQVKYGHPSETPVITASAPANVKWGGVARVSGSVTGSKGPVSGATVYVWGKEAGTNSWRKVATGKTDASGGYSVEVTPKKKTAYQARYLGYSRYLPTKSANVSVIPYAYLSRPTAPTTVKAAVAFTSSGYLKPRHASGAKSVKILCYRSEKQVDGSYKYVLRKTFSAVNANYSTYTKYSARVTLPSKGKWKMVAKIDGDSTHATTKSSARYRTVE